MANTTILLDALPRNPGNLTLPDEMNITKLTHLYPSHLDQVMHSPSSILIMLLAFIALLLALVIFCLLTNPVPRQERKEQKETDIISRTKKQEENDLKIDYSHLKIAHDLDNHDKDAGKNGLSKETQTATPKTLQGIKTTLSKSTTNKAQKNKSNFKDASQLSSRSYMPSFASKVSAADSVMSKNVKSSNSVFSVKSNSSLGAITTSVTQ